MTGDFHYPNQLTGKELDKYLETGWFRMGQCIFTVDEFPFKGIWHPVFWLRINLSQLNYGKTARKIMAANRGFQVNIRPLKISPEIEELYSHYRSAIDFDAPDTVGGHLLEGGIYSIYDTQIIEIRENNQLIAAGIFDQGETSIAGIMNFYHPHYKSKSLGKYLMILKAQYAAQKGKQFYYPGYIAKDYPKFDYKTFMDPLATEVYDRVTLTWVPLREFMAKVENPECSEKQG